MSYEIVKSIKIDKINKKVFINCASNNVRPLYFSNEEYPYFSKILQEKGIQETEIALLKEFESGNLQTSLNLKYAKALKVLYYIFKDEYAKFNWRNHNAKYGSEEEKAERSLRDSEEFNTLLLKALNTSLPKEKYIIIKKSYNGLNYVYKTTKAHIFYTSDKEQAKIFDFKEQAESISKMVNGEILSQKCFTTSPTTKDLTLSNTLTQGENGN